MVIRSYHLNNGNSQVSMWWSPSLHFQSLIVPHKADGKWKEIISILEVRLHYYQYIHVPGITHEYATLRYDNVSLDRLLCVPYAMVKYCLSNRKYFDNDTDLHGSAHITPTC